jgi:hypothetical protein
MPYVAQNYDRNPEAPLGRWVGDPPYNGQCVSFVKAVVPRIPETRIWKRGALVKHNGPQTGHGDCNF